MSWFRKKKNTDVPPVQTASGYAAKHPFGDLYCCTHGSRIERMLYKELRKKVPVIDAAIYKIIRLVGGFRIKCVDEDIQAKMDEFTKTIPCGPTSFGLESFLSAYLEQLLTFGTAVGEIVPSSDGSIASLYLSDPDDVELICRDNPLDVRICAIDECGQRREVTYPELILRSAIMPEPGQAYGTSILRGLPFISDILMKIFHALETNWDRVGNVRFAVTYKPPESDRSMSRERIMMIADEWSKAMKSSEPRDFISVGDVNIKAIGADNQIPDSQIPARLLLEQIVAKLSVPPFLLGLSWSTTEHMSSQQADILTSELEYYRRILEVPIRKICTTYLHFEGLDDRFTIEWDNINLQDEVELARARLYNAQAEKLEGKE